MGTSDVLTPPLALVRPRRALRRSGLMAVLIAGVPLFAVLYWVSAQHGMWWHVLLTQVALSAVCVFLSVRYRLGRVVVTEDEIVKQALLRRTVVKRADVASTTISFTYRVSSPETVAQFVARDGNGAVLFRMRGLFWELADMHLVADAIGAPLTVDPVPTTIAEFYLENPGVAYWYETLGSR